VAEVKQRLKQAVRSALNNDSDKPDQVTSLTLLIRAFRADLGLLGEGVARRGGLQRRNEVSTMEVRSVRTPQPARSLSEELIFRIDPVRIAPVIQAAPHTVFGTGHG